MKEGFWAKVEGTHILGGSLYLNSGGEIFPTTIGRPKAAICPNCGEVSWYIEDISGVNLE